jgi:hypothetical protein
VKAITAIRRAAELRAAELGHKLVSAWHVVDRDTPHERYVAYCRRCIGGVEVNAETIHPPGFRPRPPGAYGRAVEEQCIFDRFTDPTAKDLLAEERAAARDRAGYVVVCRPAEGDAPTGETAELVLCTRTVFRTRAAAERYASGIARAGVAVVAGRWFGLRDDAAARGFAEAGEGP